MPQRNARALAGIDSVMPQGKMHKLIELRFRKVEGEGRPPLGVERMLRMYVTQRCCGLSDEGIEDVIYDSPAIRTFVGIDLAHKSAPEVKTLLWFHHLFEAKELTPKIFDAINGHLAEKGLTMREGTIVDATLVAAPLSTKNMEGKRDPAMHQSKTGNDWHFGIKAHIGVDVASTLVRTVVSRACNVSQVTQAHSRPRSGESAAQATTAVQLRIVEMNSLRQLKSRDRRSVGRETIHEKVRVRVGARDGNIWNDLVIQLSAKAQRGFENFQLQGT